MEQGEHAPEEATKDLPSIVQVLRAAAFLFIPHPWKRLLLSVLAIPTIFLFIFYFLFFGFIFSPLINPSLLFDQKKPTNKLQIQAILNDTDAEAQGAALVSLRRMLSIPRNPPIKAVLE